MARRRWFIARTEIPKKDTSEDGYTSIWKENKNAKERRSTGHDNKAPLKRGNLEKLRRPLDLDGILVQNISLPHSNDTRTTSPFLHKTLQHRGPRGEEPKRDWGPLARSELLISELEAIASGHSSKLPRQKPSPPREFSPYKPLLKALGPQHEARHKAEEKRRIKSAFSRQRRLRPAAEKTNQISPEIA
ncbi:hypothetical protein F2Q69_00033947 [Brassica cretica]|uniref:Uncharacterized protein n=1 Tax=Brassica cretica TaxID=69181 RepID=A0A8S9SJV6_BRACR|nr:hypothetical protein F2Q69_00033947 [Brassica cretica]